MEVVFWRKKIVENLCWNFDRENQKFPKVCNLVSENLPSLGNGAVNLSLLLSQIVNDVCHLL